jgi:hypothetical protein
VVAVSLSFAGKSFDTDDPLGLIKCVLGV